MTVHLKPFRELAPEELHAIARLRQSVFYLEQRVDCEDLDAADLCSVFLWAETAGRIVGVLRIVPPGALHTEASVGRVAVAADYRRRGFARRMMQAALEYVDRTWDAPVLISAQLYIVPFYERLGFEAVSEPYCEAGIPHRKMIRKRWHA